MSYTDRRREERYSVDLSCTVGTDKVPMRVCDVSFSGVGVKGNVTLFQLHQVEVEIDIRIGFSKHILLRGVVRDIQPMDDCTRYGLEVFDVPTKWIKFVQSNASKKGECLFA